MQENDSNVQLLGFKQTLIQTLLFYRTHFDKIISVVLVFFIPFSLTEYFLWHNEKLDKELVVRTSSFVLETMNIIIIVLGVAYFFIYLFSLIYAIDALERKKKCSIIEVYRQGFKVFPQAVRANIMYIITVLLWSAALIVPGIYKLIQFSLINFILLLEKKKVSDCFALSAARIAPHLRGYIVQTVTFIIFMVALVTIIIESFDIFYVMAKNRNMISFSIALDICQGFLIFLLGVTPFIFVYQFYKNSRSEIGLKG